MAVSRRDETLSRVWDSVSELEISRLSEDKSPLGVPTDVKISDYRAKYGELVVCRTDEQNITVFLPGVIGTPRSGERITVTNIGSNSVTVRAQPGMFINKIDVSKSIASGSDGLTFVLVSATRWVTV